MTNQLEPYDDKSNQWFGATMTSSVAEDGIVAVSLWMIYYRRGRGLLRDDQHLS